MRNIARGVREPLRPEQVREFARSQRSSREPSRRQPDGHRRAKLVAERLHEMKEQSQADEVVLVTPGLDRHRRAESFVAVAEAWRQAA